MTASNLLLGVALLLCTIAAICDLRAGEIPNRLTFGAIALGGALQVATLGWFDRPPQQALTAAWLGLVLARVALGVLACGLVPYLLFLRAGMGGGDVKLLAALGATLGPVLGLELQLYAFVAMALFAPLRLLYEGRLAQVLGQSLQLLVNPLLPAARRRTVDPGSLSSFKFGPAVLVAALYVVALHWRSA